MPNVSRFQGWLGHSPDAADGRMEWDSFQPKEWTEDDVDIQVTHCGICGSDIHNLRSSYGGLSDPCCVGHEIVGRAVQIGHNVTHVQLGDRVGVGAQAYSCLKCDDCLRDREQYCQYELVPTYGFEYPGNKGRSYGGYANFNRTHGRFVFKIPDGLPSQLAAPMLCAGITMFSPLLKYECGPGKRVGIVGVGGLGHFGLIFARALGADTVVVLSPSSSRRNDFLAMGADLHIATEEEDQWQVEHAGTLDLIVCSLSSEKAHLNAYLSLLGSCGTFIQVGFSDTGSLPPIAPNILIRKGIRVGGSMIGSPREIRQMLDFASKENVTPWVETWPMNEANQAIIEMQNGKARYRYVLVQ
ncbi:chaperonin 10-like protein [Thelonectria olida]|uniref:alcohol dehydrogenase (NADP(+)) n=1 Tax=Thelonectria olida TaxID=1576542 RepID=A0A9P8VSE8_9HYPO|nr:chaperonin 10-like protein [Thelonectria olida]